MFSINRPIATAGLIGSSSLAVGIALSSGYVIFVGVIVAIGYLWLRLEQPPVSKQSDQKIDPEVVRQKTVTWADPDYDLSTRRQLQPHLAQREGTQSPATQQSTAPTNGDNKPESDKTQESNAMSLDRSDLQFRWESETDVSFDDVGGMGDVKQELHRDVVKPLTTHRKQAEALGISTSNIVFYGPPGTGKTHLAKAVATELGFPFASLTGTDVQSKWINESAEKVQSLFDEAKRLAIAEGGAVVFIDELDTILKSRTNQRSHEEDTKVVNEFLTHLEATDDHDIVFIGATNRMDSLDEAGIRAGRIDKKIHIGLPDRETRRDILHVQLSDRPNSLTGGHLDQIAGWANEYTAADLQQIVDNAARASLARDDDKITWLDIRRVMSVNSD